MAHFITEKCTGCGVCEMKCPAAAITGVKKERYRVFPNLCIDCRVCGQYCPVSAITDQDGQVVERVKPKDIPKAVVLREECSGCELCVGICPHHAITLAPYNESDSYNRVAQVNARPCVGCRLCQDICIKEAIRIPELACISHGRPSETP